DVNVTGSMTATNLTLTATGAVSVTQSILATGGNISIDDTTGTGITVTNTTIRAQNAVGDTSNNGTITIIGGVLLDGSTATAGTGRSVSLKGPAARNVVITGSDIRAGDVTLSAGAGNDVIFNANAQLIV